MILKKQNKKIIASIFMIIFILLSTVLSFTYIYSGTISSCWESLIEGANVSEAGINNTIMEYTDLLEELSEIIVKYDLKDEQIVNMISGKKVTELNSPIRMVLKDGYGITEYGAEEDMSKYYDYAKLEKMWSEGNSISSVHDDVFNPGNMVMEQVFPLIKDDELQGFLISTVKVKEIEEKVSKSSEKGRVIIYIIDRRDGYIFVKTDRSNVNYIDELEDDMIIKGYSFDQWREDIITCKSSRSAIYDKKTQLNYYTFSLPVEGTPWTVTVKLDEPTAFKSLYTVRRVFYILSLCEMIAFSTYMLWNYKETKAQIEAENKEYSEIAKALSGSYEMIYYVNILDDTYSEFNKKGDTSELDIFCTGKNFFDESVSNLRRVAHQDDLKNLLDFINKDRLVEKLRFGEFVSQEYRLMVLGKPVYFRMKAVKSNEDSNHIIFAVENIDSEVREDKKRQAELEKAVSMANSASRAKTVFLNNMSHDIRTPINAITGYTELASSHIDSKELIKEYLDKISQASAHLLSLINDVLDMSRIESGKVTINEKPENLAELVHNLRDMVQGDMASKHMSFHLECNDVENENVFCDKLRVNQVLLNILSNAIKYTKEGGRISFSVTEKECSHPGYSTYEFCVSDNGMGMNKNFLKVIFEPFTRVKTSTVSGIQGTGLGMSITKNIVDLMGGKIEIESEENVGTEVRIRFDFKIVYYDETVIPTYTELDSTECIVIDSCEDACDNLVHMLIKMGIKVVHYSTVQEAIKNCRDLKKENINVLIIDRELVKDDLFISEMQPYLSEDSKIVFVSSYDQAEYSEIKSNEVKIITLAKPLFKSDIYNIITSQGHVDEDGEKTKEDVAVEGKKILLVEDNEFNREIATEILSDNGFIVESADDGTVAVEMMSKANKDTYDLILMDIQMPCMDGYEATRRIRALADKDVANIPIIAMTANAFDEDKKAAKEAGMNAHLSKPLDIKLVISTIKEYV